MKTVDGDVKHFLKGLKVSGKTRRGAQALSLWFDRENSLQLAEGLLRAGRIMNSTEEVEVLVFDGGQRKSTSPVRLFRKAAKANG